MKIIRKIVAALWVSVSPLNFKNKFQVGMVNIFFFFWLYHLSYKEISLQFLVYRWESSRQTKPTPSTQI